MEIFEITKRYTLNKESQKRICAYVLKEHFKLNNLQIRQHLNFRLISYVTTLFKEINEYEKTIAHNVFIELTKSKELAKEIEKQREYVEAPSLCDPNVVYRFYNDGREVKIKKRPKKDA